MNPVLVVSGTGTEVGKTVVTAAVAALAADRGDRVAVVKPAQTGEPPGPAGDLEVDPPPVRRADDPRAGPVSRTRCRPRRPPAPPAGRRSTWLRPPS